MVLFCPVKKHVSLFPSIGMEFKNKMFIFMISLSQWNFPVENLGFFPWGKPAVTQSRYPTYSKCWVFYCFHNRQHSDKDHTICSVHTDVNAYNCTRRVEALVAFSSLQGFGEKFSDAFPACDFFLFW